MRVKPKKRRRSYTANTSGTKRRQQQRAQHVAIRITIDEEPSPIEKIIHKISSTLKRIFHK